MTLDINTSLHSHTCYCDGKNTPEEMVLGAIECGCHTLGFSGHYYLNVLGKMEDWTMSHDGEAQYRKEILELREKYKDKIDILLGVELDYFCEKPDFKYDYTIGSVHYVKKDEDWIAVDIFPEKLKEKVERLYGGDFLAYAEDYYSLVKNVIKKTDCTIVGHFDLLTKFNEKYDLFDTSDGKYREIAFDALDSLITEGALFEVNTGAISRGWRTVPYPEDFIMKRMAEKGASVIITADTHSADTILFKYDLALDMLRANGVKNIYTVKNKKIVLA